MKTIGWIILKAIVCFCLLDISSVMALNNGLARTPPMGFNTWNKFGCSSQISENLMKSIADAFISQGLKDAGYEFVNIDDCWGEAGRDARGGIVANRSRFPNGMKALADYMHQKGLKLGIYTDVAAQTCAKSMPGMLGHEQQDADTFVAWGIDYAKVDYCGGSNALKSYVKVRDCFKAAVDRMKSKVPTAHPIVFSICNWGNESPWNWGDTVGNLWRTTGDINSGWGSITGIVDQNQSHWNAARIGSWNDPDMMEVGNGPNAAQERAHFSLWCIMAAPLIMGNDVRNMSANTKTVLTNTEVIAVDQDTLGGNTQKGVIQGRRVVSGASEVWVKMLKSTANADYAVLFFNRSNSRAVTISVTTAQIASVGGEMTNGKVYNVRDLWGHADKGTWTAGGTLSTPNDVPVNDVYMVRLSTAPPTIVSVVPANITTGKEGIRLDIGKGIGVSAANFSLASVEMIDLKGATVYFQRGIQTGKCSINIVGMHKGVYLVKVLSGKESVIRKVVVR